MADIRIKDLATTASTTASDDFMAVDGTTNGTRKLSAATPSFATSVTVPGVSGPTATDLTLTGGSTGASLVLGATTGGNFTATVPVSGTGVWVSKAAQGVAGVPSIQSLLTVIGGVDVSTNVAGVLTLGNAANAMTTGDTLGAVNFYNNDASGSAAGVRAAVSGVIEDASGRNGALVFSTGASATATGVGRFTSTGNLLIGTTTDAANLSGGLVINGSGTASAASNTTTGALRVTGGVGVSGAGYFGGNILSVAGKLVNSAANGATLPASNGLFQVAGQTVNGLELIGKGSTTDFVLYNSAGTSIAQVATGASTLTIPLTTSASSSTVGALTIGNGTAATNVAIGGGNVNAGGTLTATQFFTGTQGITSGVSPAVAVGVTSATTADVLSFGATARSGLLRGYHDGGGTITWQFGRYTGSFENWAELTGYTVATSGLKLFGTTPSTGVGSGALQVAGGIYAGAASVFGANVTVNGTANLGVSPTLVPLSVDFSGGSIGGYARFGPFPASNLDSALILTSSRIASGFGDVFLGRNLIPVPSADTMKTLASTGYNGLIFRGGSGATEFVGAGTSTAGAAITPTVLFSLNNTTAAATFAGAVSIGNTVAAAVAVASTHKVTMVIGGVTYYLLASNV